MSVQHCYRCRTRVRSMAEHLTTERHRMATTAVRSSGPSGAHPYRPRVALGSAAAYDAQCEERYRAALLPPTIDDVFPTEIGDGPDILAAADDMADLTIKEAAERLGLAPVTLRLQIANGKLRATKRGRDWFVSEREVERYRREHRRDHG